MLVVEKETEKVLGIHAQLNEIEDVGLRFRLEPFVIKCNYMLFKDEFGSFGVASPKTHILWEVIS